MQVKSIDRMGMVSVYFSENMVFSQSNTTARKLLAPIAESDFHLKVIQNSDQDGLMPSNFEWYLFAVTNRSISI